MHNLFLVHVLECIKQLEGDVPHLRLAHCANISMLSSLDNVVIHLAVAEKLRDDEVEGVVMKQLVDTKNVRVLDVFKYAQFIMHQRSQDLVLGNLVFFNDLYSTFDVFTTLIFWVKSELGDPDLAKGALAEDMPDLVTVLDGFDLSEAFEVLEV
jgi:hypothetical protein